MTFLNALLQALAKSAEYNAHASARPRVVVWPDGAKAWGAVVARIRGARPALLTLGPYLPEQETGPAEWIRFRLGQLSGGDVTPVVYLPGVSALEFRSPTSFPEEHRHLYPLQFTGRLFRHVNGKDWTPTLFLQSAEQGGLGVEVARDQETKQALAQALSELLETPVERLRSQAVLDAGYFHELIAPDPARLMLEWMQAPAEFRQRKGADGWAAFCSVCRGQFEFDPAKEGEAGAAERLAGREHHWRQVWTRFCDAPQSWQGVATLLKTVRPPQSDLFSTDPSLLESYPAHNQKEETLLSQQLEALATNGVPGAETHRKIQELASRHEARTAWVWSRIQETGWATFITHLLQLIRDAESFSGGATLEALRQGYQAMGWKVDRSAWRALSSLPYNPAAQKTAHALVRLVYQPWLEKLAGDAQKALAAAPCSATAPDLRPQAGRALLFVDGLRLDLAKDVAERLQAAGAQVELTTRWAPLPTVTATAKYAWSPLAELLEGGESSPDFRVQVRDGKRPMDESVLRAKVQALGFSLLDDAETGNPSLAGYGATGAFDRMGHEEGCKLARRLEEQLGEVYQRVTALLAAGWKEVELFTDHGWLLLPGGLPKYDLPRHLTMSRWGRCAVVEPGASHTFVAVPWHWNPHVSIALAHGIGCFKAGLEYAHGGFTLQEALVPTLRISRSSDAGGAVPVIANVAWKGMRLRVETRDADGYTLDLRTKAGDASSSLVDGGRRAQAENTFLVADDTKTGVSAHVVLCSPAKGVVAKLPTTVGEG